MTNIHCADENTSLLLLNTHSVVLISKPMARFAFGVVEQKNPKSTRLRDNRVNASAATDTELWEAFKQGDRDAYTVLMERHYRPLYSYGTKLTFEKELVKDCIQEVFLELWHRRTAIGVADSPRFYLLRALQRRIHRAVQRNRVFYQSSAIDPGAAFSVEFSIEADLISRQEQEERVQQLATLVATLSPRQKQLIYLRFYQDLDFDEIAKLMELNRQSVYNLLHESLLRLRKNGQGTLLPVLLMLFSYSD